MTKLGIIRCRRPPTSDTVSGSVHDSTAGDWDSSSLAFAVSRGALHSNAFGVFAAFRASPPCCGSPRAFASR